jgi:GMP synthase (glutamine-hydrolysing)
MTAPDLRAGGIAVLDFGSQYTQLIARRVRELGVYAEVFPFDAPLEMIRRHAPLGYILSGGPNSVYEDGAPQLPPALLADNLPMLGICYGMQALTHVLGGQVAGSTHREYGRADLMHHGGRLFDGVPETSSVWMSHGDRIEQPPAGFVPLAVSGNSPYAAMGDEARGLYGVQFHPEVVHTVHGARILHNFVLGVCGCQAKWNTGAFIDDAVSRIRQQVGEDGRVLLALSGGVDSSVAAALLQQAIGDRLMCVFVNTGMMRLNEPEQVAAVFGQQRGVNFTAINATEEFLGALAGVTDPEAKRKIIGKTFIDVFTRVASEQAGAGVRFLGQGTIYPDVIESAHASKVSKVIKSHHNVGGLPADLAEKFTLVEPLRDLFKDEVRKVGEVLGLPNTLIWRQPFPGPGLGIRCPGEITWERLETLRRADAIFIEELEKAGLMRYDASQLTAQCFVVLLPVKSVGVMGDNRTYQEVAALRAVATDDFMTADWARLDYALLARVSSRIVNEVSGINRVLYDITSKPPATIEWE